MAPFAGYDDFDACVADNQDVDDPEAYCAEIKRKTESELSEREEKALEESECGEGHVSVDGKCVPVEEVDAPAPLLNSSESMHLTLKSLDSEPIERIEEGENTVRYTSVKLLSPGIWTDDGSKQATYYSPEGIANLTPEWDDSEHDGPPLNIMHDLDMEEFEAHEASVAGHIDPDTLDTDDDDNLYADLVFDTSVGAGQFADENLKSTLENEGRVGFGGPSVEIPAEGLEQSHDQARDMPRVDGGLLTGAAMVMEPASKTVNFAREAARRPIAMSGSKDAKAFTLKDAGMSPEVDRGEIRAEVLGRTLQVDEIQEEAQSIADELDVPVGEVMEVLDPLLDMDDEGEGEPEGDGEDTEMEDDPEDEEEEDEKEMDDMDALRDQVANLSERLEDVEDAVAQAMSADEVESELQEVQQKLADAETVKELEEAKEELDRRLSQIEEEPAESRTLADSGDSEGFDFSDADSDIEYDPATGSMSGGR